MAGKVTRMSKIKQLLQRHRDGASNRSIARELCIYKGTVNDYVNKVAQNNLDVNELLKLDDPVLEALLSAGTPAYLDARFNVFKEQIPYLEKELRRPHVTRKLLWQEYIKEYPDGYRYTQFCFHLNQQLVARKSSAILVHNPAEKLFVDFAGDTMEYIDRLTGEVIKVWVFVACFPYSDYAFTLAVAHQSTEEFIYALSCCLRSFGGCPKLIVPDNLKAAVIKADRFEPELNKVMEDFGNHYGIVALPARVRKPKDKALVENQVKLVYQRIYAKLRNQTFFSLEELNLALQEKTMEYNQTRMQQKDYSRQEKFLADEKPLLGPLPETDFQIKYYTQLRVAPNNCIYLGRDKHYYSVPFAYISQNVQVVYTRTLVKIFSDKGIPIATHERRIGFGYTTVKDHLCSAHQFYYSRSPAFYLTAARKVSAWLAVLVEALFLKAEEPEVLYRRCDGLLSLQRKTDPVLFEKACRLAVENDILTYRFVKNVIENKATEAEKQERLPIPKHDNIRGKEFFN